MKNRPPIEEPGYELRSLSALKTESNQLYILTVTKAMEEKVVNYQPKNSKMTALHRAVASAQCDKVHLLKLAGADPSLKDKNNKTPIDLANELNDSEPSKKKILWLLQTKLAPCGGHPLCMCHMMPGEPQLDASKDSINKIKKP